MELEFFSLVGHQPTFHVPDTGNPSGSAVLRYPDGTELDCGPGKVESDRVWSWPALGGTFEAPRMAFRVPGPFVDPGPHTLVVTQDDQDGDTVVDTYTIEVRYDLVDLVEKGTLGEFGQLNQIRSLTGRKPFDLSEGATTDGYTHVEIAAINHYRARKGWKALEG